MHHLMLLMLPIIEGAALSPARSLRASSLLLHKGIEAMDPLGIDERNGKAASGAQTINSYGTSNSL